MSTAAVCLGGCARVMSQTEIATDLPDLTRPRRGAPDGFAQATKQSLVRRRASRLVRWLDDRSERAGSSTSSPEEP